MYKGRDLWQQGILNRGHWATKRWPGMCSNRPIAFVEASMPQANSVRLKLNIDR